MREQTVVAERVKTGKQFWVPEALATDRADDKLLLDLLQRLHGDGM